MNNPPPGKPKLVKMPNQPKKGSVIPVRSWNVRDWNVFVSAAKKLRDARDAHSRKHRVVNSCDTVNVDFFAIEKVLGYIEEFESDMRKMVKVRDILDMK